VTEAARAAGVLPLEGDAVTATARDREILETVAVEVPHGRLEGEEVAALGPLPEEVGVEDLHETVCASSVARQRHANTAPR
jgi:hypothetical protein